MIFQLTALSPEAQEIVFVDFRKHNASAIFDEMDTENQPIYYTPQTLIARAFVYIRSRDSTQAAEKAWGAALYSVKLLFLSLGIHNSSHRSNKWLAEFAIDTMNVEKRKNMKRLFEKAEFCHEIFCGSSRCSEDILFNLLEDIQDFVEEFRTIVRGDVQTKLDNFIDEKTTFDDGSIRFNAKQGKLAEFGGIVDLHYEYEFS
uniref:Uncharacterized protein n=1 Tax=Panagrolaimus superbus TaxID=310955 RepID=A0A914YBX8_9BILA